MVMRKRRPPPFARRESAAAATKSDDEPRQQTTPVARDAVLENKDATQAQAVPRRRRKPFVL
ncbi:MAG TPA: hypothetical protein VFC24_01590 [Casimicrobiaceae bacterium]|nr:hypothetical protein [Casimicrobiaceae bacterium]